MLDRNMQNISWTIWKNSIKYQLIRMETNTLDSSWIGIIPTKWCTCWCPVISPRYNISSMIHILPNQKVCNIHTICLIIPKGTSKILGKENEHFIQLVTGTLNYYAWTVDNTLFTELRANEAKQAKPISDTMDKTKQVFDYCAKEEKSVNISSKWNVVGSPQWCWIPQWINCTKLSFFSVTCCSH